MSRGSWAEPEHRADQQQRGSVVGGALGVAGGQGAELFEPVEAPLDDVALLVPVAVELRRSSTGRTELQPVRPLVALLRDRVGDAATAQRPAGGGMGVGPYGEEGIGKSERPPGAATVHPDIVEQG